jgi:hypothetical protein
MKVRPCIPILIEELLPLPDHAEEAVVEDDDLDGQVVLDGRCQFLYVHLYAAVSRDIHDKGLREGHLGAYAAGNRTPS